VQPERLTNAASIARRQEQDAKSPPFQPPPQPASQPEAEAEPKPGTGSATPIPGWINKLRRGEEIS
jgi:hypothetical protein